MLSIWNDKRHTPHNTTGAIHTTAQERDATGAGLCTKARVVNKLKAPGNITKK